MKKIIALPLIHLPVSFATVQCPVDGLAKYTWDNPTVEEQIEVEANQSEASNDSVSFRGNVVAKRGRGTFYGEHIIYNRNKRDIHAPATMIYGTPEFAIRAEKGDYSLTRKSGTFHGLDYYIRKGDVTGEAEQADVDRQTNQETLLQATYSTCPRARRAWAIKADKVHFDHGVGVGKAWKTTFHLGDTPVLYLPYFSFPIDDRRKTGLLFPSVNLSEGRGVDVTVPFYLNLAPNHDATLYPRLMQKRGAMLGATYRYLLPDSFGKFSGTYLSHDRKADTKRWSFSTRHTYTPNEKFRLQAQYQRVSDKDYISNFENSLDLSNDNFLESHLKATYRHTPNWRFAGEVMQYQVANSRYKKAERPYAVLPRLTAQGSYNLDNGMQLASDSEIIQFHKEDQLSGWRFNQRWTASYRFENSYAYLEPEARLHLTHYRLRNQTDGKDNRLSRAVPSFSLDSGVFFDRQMTWFGNRATQTLAPRLYYLYTPNRDQSDFPRFDSSENSMTSYNALFLPNRFTGKDRIGDANQLTTAISSTISDNDSGKELAKLSVGQVQYFEDRKVSLYDAVQTGSRSNVIAEGQVQIGDNIQLRGFAHYDTDESLTEKSMVGLTYAPDWDKSVRLSHLYDRDNYKQLDVAGVWRVNDHWRTFWRWHYSLEYDKTMDAMAGVEYADCCWGVRLLGRQQRDSVTDDSDLENTVYLEFFLKGLGNVGSDTSNVLQSLVPNYRPIGYE